MKNFEFKSQVCTDKNQSRKLLELGLKKETADMTIIKIGEHYCEFAGKVEISCGTIRMNGEEIDNGVKEHIPAWSLHRLLCLYGLDYTIKEVYNNAEECYGMLICAIEIAIEDEYFNQDYLEDKK